LALPHLFYFQPLAVPAKHTLKQTLERVDVHHGQLVAGLFQGVLQPDGGVPSLLHLGLAHGESEGNSLTVGCKAPIKIRVARLINFRVTDAEARLLKKMAKKDGRTMTSWFRQMLIKEAKRRNGAHK
jgi:hypothetical protein